MAGEFTVVSFRNVLNETCTQEVYNDTNAVAKVVQPLAPVTPAVSIREDEIDVFPNPFAASFKLNIRLADEKNVAVIVVNPVGKVVFNKSSRQLTEAYYTIDLANAAPGMYFVSVNINGITHSRKLVKLR